MTAAARDIVARHAIRNVLALHSRGVDRADAALLGGAYHDDATVDYGFFAGPAAQLVAILADAQAGTPPTLHRTCNSWIAVNGDAAVSESYVIAYVEEPGMQRFVLGRYLDRHELRGGDWRMVHRQYLMEGNANWPGDAARPTAQGDFAGYVPQGAKRGTDPGRALLTHFRAKGDSAMATTATDDTALSAAIAREEIHQLVMAYSRGVDRADAALLRSIFADDAVVSLGITNGSASQFVDDVNAFVRGDAVRTVFHSVANEWIEVNGDDAVGEHYAIAHLVMDGTESMTGGRYVDRYVRRNGRWLIAERAFVTDWTTSREATQQDDGMYESLDARGTKDRTDPVYALWDSLA